LNFFLSIPFKENTETIIFSKPNRSASAILCSTRFTFRISPDKPTSAAKHILDEECHCFAGADMSTKLKLMGVDVASVGDAHAMTPGALSYFYADEHALVYKKIVGK
jgi:hypothetical protein